MSRRQALRMLGAGAGATALALLTGGRAAADPKLCKRCFYGTGRPCNSHKNSVVCVGAGQSCPPPPNPGHPLCGSQTFHCPHGC